jgi:hypothetical protein
MSVGRLFFVGRAVHPQLFWSDLKVAFKDALRGRYLRRTCFYSIVVGGNDGGFFFEVYFSCWDGSPRRTKKY